MPTVYRRRQRIPELSGQVRGGLAVVVHSPLDVGALQQLVGRSASLPGDPIDNLYRAVANAGASFAEWARLESSPNRHEDSGPESEDARVWALRKSLDHAADLWKEQGDDTNHLALALVVPRPGRRATLDCSRPALVLDYGSIRARVLEAGGRVREFGVALFPIARSKRKANLVEALRDRATGTRLPRLEAIKAADLSNKTAVVLFLHGLMSTDVGTFDTFVDMVRNNAVHGNSTLLVSWPHDTLDPIALNAEVLSELIEERLGPSGLPILFVCHSRGGLVARRTAVELLEINRERWHPRLRGCVTFGTPHDGAELAENGDELIGKLILMRNVAKEAGFIPLIDALFAVKGRKSLDGITDLRPRSNGGSFLRKLKKAEGRLARKAGAQPLPLYAVGGNAKASGLAGVLSRRYFGGAANDLVVPFASATPAAAEKTAEALCDHFGYFNANEMGRPAATDAIDFLLSTIHPPAPEPKSSTSAPRTSTTIRYDPAKVGKAAP